MFRFRRPTPPAAASRMIISREMCNRQYRRRRPRAKQCGGCGVEMQTSNPGVAGFYPPEKSSSSESDIVCQRCYSLTHYGRDLPLVMAPERYERELKQLRRAPGLVLQAIIHCTLQYPGFSFVQHCDRLRCQSALHYNVHL